MSYQPTNWSCGDVVTAEALNKIEQGIANGGGGAVEPLFVEYDHVSGSNVVYNRTWQECVDALLDGRPVILVKDDDLDPTIVGYYPLCDIFRTNGTPPYCAYFGSGAATPTYATSPSGYLTESGVE